MRFICCLLFLCGLAQADDQGLRGLFSTVGYQTEIISHTQIADSLNRPSYSNEIYDISSVNLAIGYNFEPIKAYVGMAINDTYPFDQPSSADLYLGLGAEMPIHPYGYIELAGELYSPTERNFDFQDEQFTRGLSPALAIAYSLEARSEGGPLGFKVTGYIAKDTLGIGNYQPSAKVEIVFPAILWLLFMQ